MRLPNSAHESHPWRIHEIVPDFTLEDVWALPAQGGAEDFQDAARAGGSSDPANAESAPDPLPLAACATASACWFDLGQISAPDEGDGDAGRAADPRHRRDLPAPTACRPTCAAPRRTSTSARCPSCRSTAPTSRPPPRSRTRPCTGSLHLAWVDQGDGRYQGQMAVYVKPRGRFGKAYMALIKPFRYLIVYPALTRQTERMWETRAARRGELSRSA